jgi:hypothetical protein
MCTDVWTLHYNVSLPRFSNDLSSRSLGCLLVECYIGQPLFDPEDNAELVRQVHIITNCKCMPSLQLLL